MRLAVVILVVVLYLFGAVMVSVSVNARVVDVPYPDATPFQSYEQLEEWVTNYKGTRYYWLPIRKYDCEDFAISMLLDARQDGYLLLTDRENDHLWVIAPVFNENRFYYIDAETRTLYKYFQGAEWRID